MRDPIHFIPSLDLTDLVRLSIPFVSIGHKTLKLLQLRWLVWLVPHRTFRYLFPCPLAIPLPFSLFLVGHSPPKPSPLCTRTATLWHTQPQQAPSIITSIVASIQWHETAIGPKAVPICAAVVRQRQHPLELYVIILNSIITVSQPNHPLTRCLDRKPSIKTILLRRRPTTLPLLLPM